MLIDGIAFFGFDMAKLVLAKHVLERPEVDHRYTVYGVWQGNSKQHEQLDLTWLGSPPDCNLVPPEPGPWSEQLYWIG